MIQKTLSSISNKEELNKIKTMKSILDVLSENIIIKKKPEFERLVNFSDFREHPIHRWFRYREGYSIELVKKFIEKNDKKVLDPFCGSGTTLIASKELGIDSIGLDINPIASFISRTKIEDYSKDDIQILKEMTKEVLDIQDKSRISKKPNLKIINKIFNEEILSTLLKIKYKIKAVKENKYMNFLMLGWLSILESVSNTKKEGNGIKYKFTKRTKKGYIQLPQNEWEEEHFGKNKVKVVINALQIKYNEMINDLEKSPLKKCESKCYRASSLNISEYVEEETVSTCIFSPPYANAFDYFEIFKVELWMGDFAKDYDQLKKLRRQALRSNFNVSGIGKAKTNFKQEDLEKLLALFDQKQIWDKKLNSLIQGYFEDMFLTLKQIYDVLEPNGKCIIVVGNSAYSGVVIPTDLVLSKIGLNIGFDEVEINITRHLTTSSQQKESLRFVKDFLRESVIVLHKPSESKYKKVKELPLKEKIKEEERFLVASNNVSYLTHTFHKFPAKFIPQIPRWAIRKYANGKKKVLDPFCGSGTTLVEAMLSGNRAYGIDIDPLARLISKVKTTKIPDIDKVKLEVIEKINKKKKGTFKPAILTLNHWFNKEAIHGLSIIRDVVEEYKDNKDAYDFLIVCLSSIIRRVSNADNESQKTYVSHTMIKKPELPIPLFKKTIETYSQRLKDYFKEVPKNAKATILFNCTDSRNFSEYWEKNVDGKVDVAITSPPYIKAIDYIYNQMVEHFWIGDLFGLENQKLQNKYSQKYMGTQKVLAKIYSEKCHTDYPEINKQVDKVFDKNKKFAYILSKFFIDMEQNICQVRKILKKKGHYIIVIGNNSVSGIPIDSHKFIAQIGKKNGFEVSNFFAYKIRNRFMRFPRKGRGGLIKEDWIIDLKKK